MVEPINKRKRFTIMKNTDEEVLYYTNNSPSNNHQQNNGPSNGRQSRDSFDENVDGIPEARSGESNGIRDLFETNNRQQKALDENGMRELDSTLSRQASITSPPVEISFGETTAPRSSANYMSRNSDVISPSNYMHAGNILNETMPVIKKGARGRPKKATETVEWTDDASEALIQLWQSKEELYNRQHPYFYVKEAKEKAIESIRESLEKMGFKISSSQIFSKFQSLRTYFCSQRTKIASARKNGICDDEYLESKWRFYKRLQFLDDNMKQRETYRGSSKYQDGYGAGGYQDDIKFSRSMALDESLPNGSDKFHDFRHHPSVDHHADMPKRFGVKMETFSPPPAQVKDEDQSFGELIGNMVRQIKDSREKDMLKIEIQQMIIRAKYANNKPNNGVGATTSPQPAVSTNGGGAYNNNSNESNNSFSANHNTLL